MNRMEVGTRIRQIRKRLGITMKQLATKVGVSYLTIFRIETGKVSPSVALLTEIAFCLNYPISSFLIPHEKGIIHIKANEQPVIESHNLKLRLTAPKGVIDENISITVGKAEKGEFVSRHKNIGFELAYIIKGKCIFKYGDKEYELNEGDLLYFDAQVPHSVFALEPHEFFGINFIKK